MMPDFRWNPNIEGPLFHGQPLNLKPGDTRPGVRINDGVFYTAWTSADGIPVTRRGGGKPDLPLHRVASMISANIELGSRDRIELHWGIGAGSTHVTRLERPTDPDVSYEIMIENDPSLADPSMAMSHFRKYYHVIVGHYDEFDVVYGRSGRSTPDVPCMTGVLGEGDDG
jgi:hypothetical protein